MKMWVIIGTLLVSLFFLLPSVVPPNSPYAKYLPGKKLNLGLDLRGGIHVVLGVEVAKALDVELDKFMVDTQDRAKDKKIAIQSVERSVGDRTFVAHFAHEQDAAA